MATKTPRGERRQRADGAQTRAKVLKAALDCIIEKGYYAASTNEIARHAGVTWGTLQHQFGTRENLLLEVMDMRWREFEASMESATITGDTLEARLGELFEILAKHYDGPAHVAHLQIGLDLASNPKVSDEARAAADARLGRELSRAWLPLFRQVLGDEAASRRVVLSAIYLPLRGFLTGNAVWGRLSPGTRKGKELSEERRLLIEGIAWTVRRYCAEHDIALA